jgi:dUTP pyrophosphatase
MFEGIIEKIRVSTVKVKLTAPNARPTRAHTTDAGADLRSTSEITIYPNEIKSVGTGVAMEIPDGYVGLVFSRSGMGKHGVTLANSVGVIDSEYRGELKVMLQNFGQDPFQINIGDRIAQIVLMPIILPEFEQFEGSDEEWNNSSRGTNGFGSSGIK